MYTYVPQAYLVECPGTQAIIWELGLKPGSSESNKSLQPQRPAYRV